MNIFRKSRWNSPGRKSTYAALIITLLALAAIIWAIAPITSFFNTYTQRQSEKTVENIIGRELERVSRQATELANSESLAFYLKHESYADLLAYSLSESVKRDVPGILVTDERGMVLARTINPLVRGDFIFETTSWGREVSRGVEVASIESGATIPLVLVAGQQIREKEGKMLGAVFTAESLTSAYAHRLRDKYLPAGAELIFVDKRHGLVGSSFDNEETTALLEANLNTPMPNPGGKFIFPWQDRIRAGEREYIVAAHPLQGMDEATGYVLIFIPASSTTFAIFLAGCLTLLFLLCEIFLHRYFPHTTRNHLFILSMLSMALFIGSILILQSRQDSTITRLSRPEQTIYNSVMRLQPESAVFSEHFEQRVAIKVLTSGEYVNAIAASLKYDPANVEVVEIITENSVCPEETFVEKGIDRESGRVIVTCIIPAPGFTGEGTVAEVIIKPARSGVFALTFGEDTEVKAHDGLGTDVLRQKTGGSYQSVDLEATLNDGPFILHSSSHANRERWYSNKLVKLTWSQADKPGYVYLLDKRLFTHIPPSSSNTEDNVIAVTAPGDGIYYFHLARTADEANAEKLIPVAQTYQVKIDTTPPRAPEIKASADKVATGEVVRFEFSSADGGSGIQRTFYFKVDDGIFLPVRRELSMPFYDKGEHVVTVRAFDLANNFTDTSITIAVE